MGDFWVLVLIIQLLNNTRRSESMNLGVLGLIHGHLNVIYAAHNNPIIATEILTNSETTLNYCFNVPKNLAQNIHLIK